MDLSVLEGNDPAGYKVEAKLKAIKERMEKGRRGKKKNLQNTGPSSGRRSRFVDVKKSSGTGGKGRIQRELDEKFKKHKEEVQDELEKKTTKRRERRQRRKQKGKAMIFDKIKLDNE